MAQNPDFFNEAIDVRSIMRQVANQVNDQLAKELRLWAREINRNVTRGEGLERMHREIGEGARRAVLSAYSMSRIGNRPYRQNDRGNFKRYSDGKMEDAILNKNTITYDRTGISFIHKSEMDRFARQWYRLNFGTVGRGSTRPNTPPMKFFGITTSARASLDNNKPSAPFSMPAGWWSSTFKGSTAGTALRRASGAGDAFYAYNPKGLPRPSKTMRMSPRLGYTRGIHGKSFLDAGAVYINKEYPKRFEALMVDWLSRKKK